MFENQSSFVSELTLTQKTELCTKRYSRPSADKVTQMQSNVDELQQPTSYIKGKR